MHKSCLSKAFFTKTI